MRKTLNAQRRVNGRRGSFQLLFGVVYLFVGYSYLFMEASPARRVALAWIGEYGNLLGLVWIVAGLLAFVGCIRPRGKDSCSFAALSGAPMAFGFLYLIGVLAGAPIQGLFTVFIFLLISGAVAIVAGMQGDHDRCIRKPKL
ncbi:hypothetical protein ACFUOZ_00490 [Paenarthrobacter sp. NPDC057355]|uniref:hypothetical protein n=1 Tax=Paenarthrobacter sp. NPDC057355 TaxID=3346105 RepID=UPI0036319382